MSDLVLGIDCSTTACKAIAWDAAGRAVAEGRSAIALDNPEPGAWQQDAEQWWTATCEACRALNVDRGRIAALCVTNQRETFVVTDDDGVPKHPALVWMDARCREQVAKAAEDLGRDRLHAISGKPASTTPSFYKLLYLLEREPSLRGAAVLDVHAYVVRRLTGVAATSLAAADPSGLVDMEQRAWSEELCHYAGLTPAQLPALFEPGEAIGELSQTAAAATGLSRGLPVIAGAGDGQCAGLGAGIADAGRAYLNLGTAIVSGVLSGEYRTDNAFRTLYAASGGYFLETDLQGGTFTLTWLSETFLGGAHSIAELAADAERVARGSEGLLVLPYWNGVMNPYWDDAAGGVVVGLRGHHTPAHLYRAVLEGIAMEQRLHTRGVEAATAPIAELVVMGGGSQSDLWCQVIADTLERPIVRAGDARSHGARRRDFGGSARGAASDDRGGDGGDDARRPAFRARGVGHGSLPQAVRR